MNMNHLPASRGYTIPTLLDKKRDGIYGIAYCPICDRAEESHDQGNGGGFAVARSVDKVRKHMRTKHRFKAVGAPESVH